MDFFLCFFLDLDFFFEGAFDALSCDRFAPGISASQSSSIAAASAAAASISLNTSGDSLSTEEEDGGGGGGGEGVNGHANASASAANKEGKLTLTALLEEGLVEPGVGVMSIDYLGQVSRSR